MMMNKTRNDDEQEFLFSNRNINNCLLVDVATNIVNLYALDYFHVS